MLEEKNNKAGNIKLCCAWNEVIHRIAGDKESQKSPLCLQCLEETVEWARPWVQLTEPIFHSSLAMLLNSHCRPVPRLGFLVLAAHPATHLRHPHPSGEAWHYPGFFHTQKTNLRPPQGVNTRYQERAGRRRSAREGGNCWRSRPENTRAPPLSASSCRAGLGEQGTFLGSIHAAHPAVCRSCSDA